MGCARCNENAGFDSEIDDLKVIKYYNIEGIELKILYGS